VTELQQNRYDVLLRRVGDLKGPGSKVNDVLEELFPTLDVENIPGELMLLSGWRLGMAGGVFAPAVGEFQHLQLFNPAGSGLLVVVERFTVRQTSNITYNLATTTTAFISQPGTQNTRDTRLPSANVSARFGEFSSAAPVSASWVFGVAANIPYDITNEKGLAILAPGSGLNVEARTADVPFSIGFYFRERVAEPSELAF